MSLEEFSTGDWIDRLARALPGLAEAQEPYLGEFWEWNPRVHVALGGRDGTAPAFPLDDVRILYQRARHNQVFGEAERYASLCAVLDPVRHILISHPTLRGSWVRASAGTTSICRSSMPAGRPLRQI